MFIRRFKGINDPYNKCLIKELQPKSYLLFSALWINKQINDSVRAQWKHLIVVDISSVPSKCLSFVLQLENYIQDSMKQDIVQIQQTAVHNHTATMIEIGTNLLSQTAEQTRKLTNVEAQVRLYNYLNILRARKKNAKKCMRVMQRRD